MGKMIQDSSNLMMTENDRCVALRDDLLRASTYHLGQHYEENIDKMRNKARPGLKELNLHNKNIKDIKFLKKCLDKLPFLEKIDLSNSEIGSKEAEELTNIL
jgi:hypothetical protein